MRSAQRLLNGCLVNGGLYIKIGQGVSAINHILPKEYTNTLKKLEVNTRHSEIKDCLIIFCRLFKNECLPRKSNEVRHIFETEFGKPPEELFSEFDYTPIAAASLAQVFKAKTKDGRSVAVKVQYIDLINRYVVDFRDLPKLVHTTTNLFSLDLKICPKLYEK